MPRMSKKRRLEWSFFLRQVKVGNTTCDRITYNDLCRGCTHSCKQSFRAVKLSENLKDGAVLIGLMQLGTRCSDGSC